MARRLQSQSYGRRVRMLSYAGPGIISIAVIIGAVLLRKNGAEASAPQLSAPIVAAFDTVDIPVVVEPVPAGTHVREIRFKTVSYPLHQVPPSALRDLSAITDGVTSVALPAHLPIYLENFRPLSGVNPVAEKIPHGMRAMTVRVDATTAVEGWAGSGSVVDVLMISKEKTTVIAERVKILSAERVTSPVEGSIAPNIPSTVTLLVTQEQCLAINTAIPLGKIAFALRSPRDEEGWFETAYSADQLQGQVAEEERRQGSVDGFISLSGAHGSQSFALSGDKWIKAEVVPEGFRVMNKDRIVEEQNAENSKSPHL